jgi:hypothetical protein
VGKLKLKKLHQLILPKGKERKENKFLIAFYLGGTVNYVIAALHQRHQSGFVRRVKKKYRSQSYQACSSLGPRFVNWKFWFMLISADFKKQQQNFYKKILLYCAIALSQYLFIVILLVKMARLTRALNVYFLSFTILNLAILL